MLSYLDNQVNRRRDPKTGAGANENYARELMELHSLGVHGGYTQKDVQEVARCLTGWTVENRFLRARGTFRFDPDLHDDGPKTVLGVTIPAGGGKSDGDRVLEILAKHPSTARFISAKLCRYFLGVEDEAWTKKLAALYLQTDGDIPSMLHPLLLSDALLESPPILKRPFDFVVSAMRALSTDMQSSLPVQEHLAQMGQALYQWPMPDGFPDRTSAWTGSLLARWNFAFALATNGLPGTQVDAPALARASGAKTEAESADALLSLILARPADSPELRPLRETVRTYLASSAGSEPGQTLSESAALLLASPAFQWR
jgi:uncharacterized protein (DUF1800 family)